MTLQMIRSIKTIIPMKYLLECLQKRSHKQYIQGQYNAEDRTREYFYYIDHQGMLFLEDARIKNFTSCFKEKKFLQFFYKRLRQNKTGRYNETFPFVSLCGRERNYVKCDDVPIVYTHLIVKDGKDVLTYGNAGDLMSALFLPDKIYMSPKTGRVYHPADDQYGGIGLIRSTLSIELSKYFDFQNGELKPPTHFQWHGKNYEINTSWVNDMTKKYNIKDVIS